MRRHHPGILKFIFSFAFCMKPVFNCWENANHQGLGTIVPGAWPSSCEIGQRMKNNGRGKDHTPLSFFWKSLENRMDKFYWQLWFRWTWKILPPRQKSKEMSFRMWFLGFPKTQSIRDSWSNMLTVLSPLHFAFPKASRCRMTWHRGRKYSC